jgi:hypothetical protein
MTSDLRHLAVLALAASATGCQDFLHPDVTPGPSPLPVTRSVTVTVQYRQPGWCVNSQGTCDYRVVFFGSWMSAGDGTTPGGPVILNASAGPSFWTGVVTNVPVNWPPVDAPHYVRVWDPHLLDTPTGGLTAARLIVGGQVITQYDSPGTSVESGLIYVDDNGVGHNPF